MLQLLQCNLAINNLVTLRHILLQNFVKIIQVGFKETVVATFMQCCKMLQFLHVFCNNSLYKDIIRVQNDETCITTVYNRCWSSDFSVHSFRTLILNLLVSQKNLGKVSLKNLLITTPLFVPHWPHYKVKIKFFERHSDRDGPGRHFVVKSGQKSISKF